ncbi:uncharacterized protein LOC109720660 [Ananas comosus]|uniref:Uncharacterized protein LOC109720660 n=1 Tax=Ananas comosus TaxID=4615 RepID=A0A6P5G4I9_ANACO|nr:uncharacterized protein LOC109720660 [Ananas comosus]
MEGGEGGSGRQSPTPCYKKRKEGEGEDFLASARDHLDQFKNTTAERHWICLKNTVRRAKNTTFFAAFFGPSKVGGESDTGANDTASSPGDPISLGFD